MKIQARLQGPVEFLGPKGLSQVGGHPGGQDLFLRILKGAGRYRNDRRIPALLQGLDAAGGLVAVHDRHAHVHEHGVGRPVLIRPRLHWLAPYPQGHPACLGELEGVSHQIDQHLSQLALICENMGRQGLIPFDDQLQPLGPVPGPEHHLQVGQEVLKAEGGRFQNGLSRLDPGDVEDVVDETKQVPSPAVDGPNVGRLPGGEGGVPLQDLGEPQDGVHGGADLVAHVAHEEAFLPARFLGGLPGDAVLFRLPLPGDVLHGRVDAHDLSRLIQDGGRSNLQDALSPGGFGLPLGLVPLSVRKGRNCRAPLARFPAGRTVEDRIAGEPTPGIRAGKPFPLGDIGGQDRHIGADEGHPHGEIIVQDPVFFLAFPQRLGHVSGQGKGPPAGPFQGP